MKCLIFASMLCGTSAALAQASAPAADTTSRVSAAAACERAAQETLQGSRRDARSVSFNAPPSTMPGAVDANEVALRLTT